MNERDARPAGFLDGPIFWEPSLAFLKYAIAFILAGSAAFEILLLVFVPEQKARALAVVILMLVAVVAWFFLKRGSITAAVRTLGVGVWVYVTLISFLFGGVSSASVFIYPPIILLVGWLVSTRAAMAVAFLTATTTLGFVYGESMGFLPLSPPTPPAMRWVVQCCVFIFTAVLIASVVRSYRNRLDEMHELDVDLARRTGELQAREADLNRAQAVAHVGSWVYELAADAMYLSAETCRIFGLPEGSQGSHESYLSRVHPEDRGAVDSAWQVALTGGATFDNEHRILVGKTVRWVRQTAELEFGADGAPVRGVGVTMDITERKRAVEELRAREARYLAVANSANDAVVTADRAGNIAGWNRGAERIFGYAEAEVIGQPLTMLMPQRYRDGHREGMVRVLSGGEHQAIGRLVELAGRRKDASEFPLELSLAQWTTYEGLFFTGFIRDITERKAAEAQIERLTRVYAALSQCNETIVRSADEQDLFEGICRAAVQFGGMKMVWVGLLDPGTRTLRFAARHGDRADEYLQGAEISVDAGKPEGRGPAGTAIRENRPVWLQDFQNEPLTAPWHERRAPFGWRASACLPLCRNGLPAGVLTLYAGEADAFDETTRRLLLEMAANISFALDNFEREAQRQRAEAELQESEARFRSLSEMSSDFYWESDAEHRLALLGSVKANLNRVSAFRRGVQTGERSWEIPSLFPDEAGWRAHRAVLEAHRTFRDFELPRHGVDGDVRHVLISGDPVFDASGAFKGYRGVGTDITGRKKAEDELRNSIAFRDLLLEAMPLPVFYKDTSGRYTGGNSAFARFIGKPMTDIVGKTVFEVSPQSFARVYRDRDLELLDDPSGLQTYESRVAHADGTPHDVIFHKVRMVDDAGRPSGILGVITDITERKHLEQAHLRAQKLESLGTLAGGIAHDFNNILAGIQGNADLAAEDVGPDHIAAESLEEIRKASVRASELVRRIMAFGRPKEVQKTLVDLGAVAGEVLKLLRSTLPAGISLTREFDPETPGVFADAGQIHEAVVNLTTNAAYAIGPRAGFIEYRLEAKQVDEKLAAGIPGLEPGRYARLTVTDNGCGMDAATRERIFDAFYTTKPVGEGTGLGLSMVHGIMKSHGGAVTVESVPGKGSSFALYFPVADSQPVSEDESAPVQSLSAVGQRVLYVDDEEALISVAKRMLSRLGHSISGFTDPEAALAAFRAQPQDFDVVVTDLSMPRMSGFELARAVLALRPGMPVLMTTGYLRAGDEDSARAAGIRELILKPVNMDVLSRVLDRLFRDYQARH